MRLLGRDTDRVSDWQIWTYLDEQIELGAERIAIVDGAARYGFSQLHGDALALAAALESSGVVAGDAVAYQLPNWYETVILAFALMRLGAVAVPIVPIYRQREIAFIVEQTRARLLIVPQLFRGHDHLATAREAVGEDRRIITCRGEQRDGDSFESLLAAFAGKAPRAALPSPDADAFYLYTSGTTANPKGVRHSQRTLIAKGLSFARMSPTTSQDVLLLPTPLTHVTGVNYANFILPILGLRVVLTDNFTPEICGGLIEAERCTFSVGATPFLQMLVQNDIVAQYDISTLKFFRCGGAGVPPQLIRAALEKGIDAVRCYGSTEHPTLSGLSYGDADSAANTDGQVPLHADIRIVDPNDDRVLPIGAIGEIQSNGPDRFLGYVDAALDVEAFTADGWFRTGDLGFLDRSRHVTITGRRKDIIIRKGENISAKEIEDVLSGHPAVENVAVIGLADEERGEKVVAVCILRSGRTLSFADMTGFFDESGLSRRKFPEELHIVESFPMTAAGKIQKVKLRDAIAGNESCR